MRLDLNVRPCSDIAAPTGREPDRSLITTLCWIGANGMTTVSIARTRNLRKIRRLFASSRAVAR